MPHRTIPGPGSENLGVLFGEKVGVLFGVLGLAHIAGFLLGAVQFFPTLQYLLLSSESRLLTSEGMLRFSLQPALSLGLIVPPRLLQNAIVNPLALNVEEIPWALSIYVGLGLVLLLPAIRNAPLFITCSPASLRFNHTFLGLLPPRGRETSQRFAFSPSSKIPRKVAPDSANSFSNRNRLRIFKCYC